MPCLLYPPQQGAPGWRLYGPENAVINVPFSPRLSSDNLQVILHAALDGQGICGIPYYACRRALARGIYKRCSAGGIHKMASWCCFTHHGVVCHRR